MQLPPPPVFRRTRRITEADADELGHVNNVVWVRFVVDLALAHSSSLGLDAEATRAHGGVWVVRRHEVEYRRSARPGDEITEETWVSEMRGARSIRHARFLDTAGQPLVTATTEWAFIDPITERPRRIPPALTGRDGP